MIRRPWKHLSLLTLLLVLLLSACGVEPLPTTIVPTVTTVPPTATSAAAAPTATVAAEATTAAPTSAVSATAMPVASTPTSAVRATATQGALAPGSFQNPIFRQDFADPFVLEVDGTFYAYGTNAAGRNIQVATSSDLINWKPDRDGLPGLPKWASLTGGLVWAPEVIKIGSGFVLYYVARDKASNKQCVGVATSAKPDGPFRDTNDKPFVCQTGEGGTIDPSPFSADGKLYLYFKNDGNCCGLSTHIYVQELAPDGLSLTGTPVALIENENAWEGAVVEAPTMWQHDGKYYLFFSGNDYAGIPYAVGYATCDTPMGPCQQATENPILASNMNVNPPIVGPGHQTLLQLGDQTWIIYHVWEIAGGARGSRRFMWLDRVDWQNGKPVVHGPTAAAQPDPDVSVPATPGATLAGSSAVTATVTVSNSATVAPAATATLAATGTISSSTTFTNPVIDQDFPDPDILTVGGTYYAYATNGWDKAAEKLTSGNIQLAKSSDLVHWQILPDPLPKLPSWAEAGNTWAPDVSAAPDGSGYVMYFVARNSALAIQCIGAAKAQTPEGPFDSPSAAPFICDDNQGGSLDPASFDENGQRYVLWKNDGNCCGLPTHIYLQKAAADGMKADLTGKILLDNDQGWEGNVVEAPTLWKHDGKYFLFYSANDYSGTGYAVGYAVADKIDGPYTKPNAPLLISDLATPPPAVGPGGQDIIAKGGQDWIVYHTWNKTIDFRNMNIDKLNWNGDTPVVAGPLKSAEPAP